MGWVLNNSTDTRLQDRHIKLLKDCKATTTKTETPSQHLFVVPVLVDLDSRTGVVKARELLVRTGLNNNKRIWGGNKPLEATAVPKEVGRKRRTNRTHGTVAWRKRRGGARNRNQPWTSNLLWCRS